MKFVNNKPRVIHFPQLGSCRESFKIEVKDEEQALFAINLMANQHWWLEKHKIIPDYSNIILVEMYDEAIDEETGAPYGWVDYWNEEECCEWDEMEEYLNHKE